MIIHFDLILIIFTSPIPISLTSPIPISPHHPKSPHHFVICDQFVIVIEKCTYLPYKCHPRTISYIMFCLQQSLLLQDIIGGVITQYPPGGICISPKPNWYGQKKMYESILKIGTGLVTDCNCKRYILLWI